MFIIVFLLSLFGMVAFGIHYSRNNFSRHVHRMVYRDVMVSVETMYIIQNSANPSTVHSRLPVLYEALSGCRRYCTHKAYHKVVVEVRYAYSRNYYDKPFPAEWLTYIYNPSLILNQWNEFCDSSMANACKEFGAKEMDAIDNLKTKKGKMNRLEKNINELETLVQVAQTPQLKSAALATLAYYKLKRDNLL